MTRVLGVELPKEKRVEIGLTYLYGIGRSTSHKILDVARIDPGKRVKDLTDEDVRTLSTIIQRDYRVEGELRREVAGNIKRLMDIGCYRGLRHKKSLPVRGQRTHTNARTRKGPRRMKISKKKKSA